MKSERVCFRPPLGLGLGRGDEQWGQLALAVLGANTYDINERLLSVRYEPIVILIWTELSIPSAKSVDHSENLVVRMKHSLNQELLLATGGDPFGAHCLPFSLRIRSAEEREDVILHHHAQVHIIKFPTRAEPVAAEQYELRCWEGVGIL